MNLSIRMAIMVLFRYTNIIWLFIIILPDKKATNENAFTPTHACTGAFLIRDTIRGLACYVENCNKALVCLEAAENSLTGKKKEYDAVWDSKNAQNPEYWTTEKTILKIRVNLNKSMFSPFY